MQLKTSNSIQFFHNIFKKKFNFEEYLDVNKPTLFFGVYGHNDIKSILNHNGKRIIWFSGMDAANENTLFSLKNLQDDGKTVFIGESKWIEEDLNKAGIKHECISLFLDNIYNWKPVPHGDKIYWYNAGNSRYGKQYLREVKRSFPDIEIITNDSKTIPREEMPKIYSQCFVGIRPVEHDGCSMSVAEMGLMGRITITNSNQPFTMPFKGSTSLIEAISELRRGYNHKLISKRSAGYFKDQETKWCNMVLSLCGIDEIDSCGIFEESVGRCGSIFRIQRKSDVEKMPYLLGTQQFERPYFSEQIQKLGKKQLITSKNSGFIVSEFKNVDKNKGYPEGINYVTRDKTTN